MALDVQPNIAFTERIRNIGFALGAKSWDFIDERID